MFKYSSIWLFLLTALAILSGCSHEYPQMDMRTAKSSNHPILRAKEERHGKRTYYQRSRYGIRVMEISEDLKTGDKEYSTALRILSEPPGAMIRINGRYLGVTPLIYMCPSDKYGFSAEEAIIEALPSEEMLADRDLYPKSTKLFGNPANFQERDIVPYRLLFDMTRKELAGDKEASISKKGS